MKNPVLYVILNKELGMSAGKAAAQVAHAVMLLSRGSRDNFLVNYRRTVIVLEAEGRVQMDGIAEYLTEAGTEYEYYIDEGENEVPAFSLTALAVEPIDADDTERRQIFENLRLYSGEGDKYEEAYEKLYRVARGFRSYDGMSPFDNTPRWMRKTLEFLEARIK